MGAGRKARVALIGTGGTISVIGRHSLDLYEYADHGRRQEIHELVDRFPEVEAEADLVPVAFRAMSSTAVSPADWLALNEAVHEVVDREAVDGVVITHGTATLEETAYFLNLTLKVDCPVVLVGSQRPSNALGTDAGMNLVNAVRLACAPEAVGLGVLVLLNDEIQAAREVTKGSTLRLEAFRSPDLGMLGYTDPDRRIAIYRSPTRRRAPDTEFEVRRKVDLPRVDIVLSYAGADGTAVSAFAAAGARAIVSAGVAPGFATPAEAAALVEARRAGVFVIQASRAGSGRVVPRAALGKQGFIAADNLSPQKARILAMLALTATQDVAELQRMFDEY